MELKTARLTVLLNPTSKREFEQICRSNDMTPSEVVRRLIRDYMEAQGKAPRAIGRRAKK